MLAAALMVAAIQFDAIKAYPVNKFTRLVWNQINFKNLQNFYKRASPVI
jgi:hypothetical protein